MHQQVVRNAVCRLQPTSFRERQHPCILEKTPTPMHTCVRGACAIPLPRSNGAHMDSRQVASFKTSCCVLIWVSNDMGIECLSTRSLPYRLAAFTRHTQSCARKRPMHCKQDTKLTKPPHKFLGKPRTVACLVFLKNWSVRFMTRFWMLSVEVIDFGCYL